MAKEKGVFTSEAYTKVKKAATASGSRVTAKAEQKQRDTGKLDSLVDPQEHGVIRRSISRKVKSGKYYVLTNGTAMAVEFRGDGTASFNTQIDESFEALPQSYDLLVRVPNAPLARYDLQMCNSIFNDVVDNGPLICRSQFEMDAKIAEQLTMLLPLRDGDDLPEDPQYSMFGSAYLTDAEINKVGLKGYDFTLTDAEAHEHIKLPVLKQVYGEEVLEKVRENGHQIDSSNLPQMKDIIPKMLENSHAFLIFIQTRDNCAPYWRKFYGDERVVVIDSAKYLHHVQAAIIGLTEGTLNLQNLEEFLIEQGGLQAGEASIITRAVAHVPMGAQAELEKFNEIPMKGDKFKKKTDTWPISESELEIMDDEPEEKNTWE